MPQKTALICYSRTGNNAAVAGALAARIGAEVETVRPARWRTILSVGFDLLTHRMPRIRPLRLDPENIDCLVVMAPVWAGEVAHPMQTALSSLNGRVGRYVFVSLCGMGAEKQRAGLAAQLTELIGHAPEATCQIAARDLVPAQKREDVRTVAAYRIDAAGLAEIDGALDEIARRIMATQPMEMAVQS